MSTHTLRIALCGYGPMGRMHAELLAGQPDAVIAGVADAEPELRERVERDTHAPAFDTAESLLDGVSAEAGEGPRRSRPSGERRPWVGRCTV